MNILTFHGWISNLVFNYDLIQSCGWLLFSLCIKLNCKHQKNITLEYHHYMYGFTIIENKWGKT